MEKVLYPRGLIRDLSDLSVPIFRVFTVTVFSVNVQNTGPFLLVTLPFLEVNWYTLRGSNSSIIILASFAI